MKLHMVFSLNVTGSFVDDIFRVVRSIRFRLFGLSLRKDVLEIISHLINMNDMIFSHFLAEKKKNLSHKKTQCNKYNIFDTNILPRGYSTKFQRVGDYNKQPLQYKMEIPVGGGGGTKVKVPSVGGMDVFSGTAQQCMFSVFY